MRDKDEKTENKKYEDSPSEDYPVSSNGKYNVNEKAVKLKLSFESSESFAKDVLNGFANSLKERAKQREIDYETRNIEQIRPMAKTARLSSKQHIEPMPSTDYQFQKNEQESFKENHLELPSRQKRQRIPFLIFSSVIISLVIYCGIKYQNYNSKKTLELARHEMMIKKEKAYNYILAHYLNDLLSNLDELTANPKMMKVFPEITSMSAIARFKRGSDPIEKAKAAKEFIYRVKYNFNNWVDRADDFTLKEKPDKKDIANFLIVWRDTEKLLSRLETAKQDPLKILLKIP